MEIRELIKKLKPRNKTELRDVRTAIYNLENKKEIKECGIREIVNPAVRKKFKYKCHFCNRDVIEVCKETGNANTLHHKLPVRYGGKHEEDNLIVICARCHPKLEVLIEMVDCAAIKNTLGYVRRLLDGNNNR